MMRPKAWVALLLLLPAVMLERIGHYGARSILMFELEASGLDARRAIQLLTIATSVSYLASVAAGGLALAIGPRPTAVLGSLLAAVGLGLLIGHTTARAGTLFVMIGAGVFRPCSIAAAAEIVSAEDVGASGQALPPSARRFATLAAIATIVYGAVNLSAAFVSASSAALHGSFGGGALFGTCVLVALLMGASALVSFSMRTSTASAGPPNVCTGCSPRPPRRPRPRRRAPSPASRSSRSPCSSTERRRTSAGASGPRGRRAHSCTRSIRSS